LEIKNTLDRIAYNSDWILRKEHSSDVFSELYPLLQFCQRLHTVAQSLSRLMYDQHTPHHSWLLLVRPIMLDGIYLTYFHFKREVKQSTEGLFYRMLGDQIQKTEDHIKSQLKWGLIDNEESEVALKKFKTTFHEFFKTDGTPKYTNMPQPVQLINQLNESKSKYFGIGQDFYTKYAILSKYEHYNILNHQLPRIIDFPNFVSMIYMNLMLVSRAIKCVPGNAIPNELVEELWSAGSKIVPNHIGE
jgi:hypothetical protein